MGDENVVAPFQSFIVAQVAVCSVCSALVPNWPEAMLNHERWHWTESEHSDGVGSDG
jgi:hypothetical protein